MTAPATLCRVLTFVLSILMIPSHLCSSQASQNTDPSQKRAYAIKKTVDEICQRLDLGENKMYRELAEELYTVIDKVL
jgi:uncharacterized protein YidB (DUF937 family)